MDTAAPLLPALTDVRDAVAPVRFDLETEQAPSARATRDELVQQLDDYLLPRLRQLDAPLLAVVGGSTGAGKSTLVNSLLRRTVTTAGVLRPTTRGPVLVCNPADTHWFEDDRVLPTLARSTGGASDPDALQLVEADELPVGLALLDAPDIDSVVAANRTLAAQLLAAADLWIFVTTAARYADAVPWEVLRAAGARDAEVFLVLDRVPVEAVEEVVNDLRRMLREHDLDRAALHTIRELPLVDGLLPADEVAPLTQWLQGLAGDAEARARVVRATLEGALDAMERSVAALQQAVTDQAAQAEMLREQVRTAYEDACHEVDTAIRGGALLRGEVLARWQEFVGTGELMRSMQARVGIVRDRLLAAVTGRATPAAGVQEAVETGVESVVHAASDGAAATSASRWRQSNAGRHLLDSVAAADRSSPEMLARLPAELRAWQGAVLDLVREQGADKRTSARIASFTLNGAGLAVMLAVFAHTGGLTGAELAVAGGTSAASQKVMEAVFGDQAVRALANQARVDLLGRVDALLRDEADRFHHVLAKAVDDERDQLGAALEAWRTARRTARS